MRVQVINVYTDQEQLFEGTAEHVRHQLLFAFPFLRDLVGAGVEELLEYLDMQQVFLVGVEEPHDDHGLIKGEQNLDPKLRQVVMDQLGFSPEQERIFDAAKFLAGGEEAPAERLRAALYANDGDLEAAALQAHGIEINEANRKALQQVASFLATQKFEEPDIDLKKVQVSASLPEGQDVAESVQRAFHDEFVFPVTLGGKHSKGVMVARDEKSNSTWLLKPGSGKQSPAMGAREEQASQSRREACFYHVAKLWGLYDYMPRCELLTIDGKEYAVMQLLPTSFQGLEKWGQKNPAFPSTVMRPLAQDGTLHRFALLDAVCGNPDRHGANEMVNEQGEVKLIDHGSAFAGPGFAPAVDKNSFVPFYLRVWAPKKAFNSMTPSGKMHFLPRVPSSVEAGLRGWVQRLSEEALEAELVRYGINPEPTVERLRHFKAQLAAGVPADEAINRFWVGADEAGTGMAA